MFIEWKNSMSVGVSESDIQHQKMISIINDFFDILRSENKKNYVEILKRLEDYADYHFSLKKNILRSLITKTRIFTLNNIVFILIKLETLKNVCLIMN